MLPPTVSRIEKAVTRMVRELDTDYATAIRAIPPLVLHALCIRMCPDLGRRLPGASDPSRFTAYVARVDTFEGLHVLLTELDEPTAGELKSILEFIGSLPKLLKRSLADAAKRIRPTGGPKIIILSDPSEVSVLVDEVFEIEKKTGRGRVEIQKEIAKRIGVEYETFRKRFSEEMKRRNSLNRSSHLK
jgi:hypothetical protein